MLSSQELDLELVVLGFFHSYRVCSRQKIIPREIVKLIEKYSETGDVFDAKASQNNVMIDILTPFIAEKPKETMKMAHAFGTALATKGCLYLWRLRILNGRRTQIGIIDKSVLNQENNSNIAYFFRKEFGGYSFDTGDGQKCHHTTDWRNYASECGGNDILNVELDMRNEKNCTLKFYCNEDRSANKCAFQSINAGKKYCLVVAMWYTMKIEILSFTISG